MNPDTLFIYQTLLPLRSDPKAFLAAARRSGIDVGATLAFDIEHGSITAIGDEVFAMVRARLGINELAPDLPPQVAPEIPEALKIEIPEALKIEIPETEAKVPDWSLTVMLGDSVSDVHPRVSRSLRAWSDVWSRLQQPKRLGMTRAQFHGLPPETQRAYKDSGYFLLGTLAPGSSRTEANVTRVYGAKLDLETRDGRPGGPATPETIRAVLQGIGAAGLAYETASSTAEAPRFRVLVPYPAGGVTPEQHRRLAGGLVAAFAAAGVRVDSGASLGASTPAFLPVVASDAPWAPFWVPGEPVAADRLPEPTGAAERASEPVALPEPLELTTEARAGLLARLPEPHRRLAEEGEWWSGDRSKDAFGWVHGALKAGLTMSEALGLARDSVLAEFGATGAHAASDPWRWFLEYCAAPAVKDFEREQAAMFEAVPAEVAAAAGLAGRDAAVWAFFRGKAASDEDATRLRAAVDEAIGLQDDALKRGEARRLATAAGYGRVADFMKVVREYRELLQQWSDGAGGAGGAGGGAVVTRADRLAELRARYVYVTPQAMLANLDTGGWERPEAVSHAEARYFGGDPRMVLNALLHSPVGAIPTASAVTYDPGLPSGLSEHPTAPGQFVLNQYRPSALVPRPGDVGPFLNHLAYLQPAEGTEYVLQYFIKAVAWKLQHPGGKVNFGVLLGGGQGIGKDLLLQPIQRAFGTHNCKTLSSEALESDFNAYLGESTFLVGNELHMIHSQRGLETQIANRLKPLLAAPPNELSVNQKYVSPYSVPNQHFWAFTTNYQRPMVLPPDDRRFCCIQFDAPAEKMMDIEERAVHRAHCLAYLEWMNSGGDSAVLDWLLKMDTRDFQPGVCPPNSKWKDGLIQAVRSPVGATLTAAVEARTGVFGLDVLPTRVILDALPERPDDASVYEVLARIGAIKWSIDGKVRAWILRNKESVRQHGAAAWLKVFAILQAPDGGLATALAHQEAMYAWM